MITVLRVTRTEISEKNKINSTILFHMVYLTDPWNSTNSTKAFMEPKYKFLSSRILNFYLNSLLGNTISWGITFQSQLTASPRVSGEIISS